MWFILKSGADPSATWIHYTGEPIGPVGSNRSDGHRVKLFEESVTFIAQLHPEVTRIEPYPKNPIGIDRARKQERVKECLFV